MRSNLMELISQKLPEWKQKGIINLEEELDELIKDFYFYDRVTYEDLKKSYLRDRLDSVANANSFYSYKKNMFVTLERATDDDLEQIDANFVRDIASREATLKRIKEEEKSRIKGQLVFTFQDNIAVGAERELSLLDKLKESYEP